ncbi:MAG TPA: phosphotransferase [Acidimicrobiales bacterium]|nr:phosphotransferase [Acidimicrobiales bacterium]
MTYLRQRGYPVPAVEEISADGSDLVMERIDGPSMVQAIGDAPWTVKRHARMLAELHVQLHELTPPDFLERISVLSGNSVLHLDLHPLNVIIGPHGPVVIDWSNASVGDPDIDVGLAWVLMAAGEIPGVRVKSTILGWVRSLLVRGFVARFDREEVASKLRSIVEVKVRDPHMSPKETDRMWRVVDRAERRASRSAGRERQPSRRQ